MNLEIYKKVLVNSVNHSREIYYISTTYKNKSTYKKFKTYLHIPTYTKLYSFNIEYRLCKRFNLYTKYDLNNNCNTLSFNKLNTQDVVRLIEDLNSELEITDNKTLYSMIKNVINIINVCLYST